MGSDQGRLAKTLRSLRRNWLWLAIPAVFPIWLVMPAVIGWMLGLYGESDLTRAGQFGDQFGAINALVSAVTILLVFLAYRDETKERRVAEKRWREERTDAERDREQAEERWREERAERVSERRRNLAASGIRHFMDAIQRYSSERASVQARGLRHLHLREPDAVVRYSGREAMVQHIARLDQTIRGHSLHLSSGESGDAKRALQHIVAEWYRDYGRDVFGPVIAHVIPMSWALYEVDLADPKAGSMLRAVAREAMTYEDVKVIYAVAMVNSDFRRFLTSIFEKNQCEVIYQQWIHDWLWSNAEDLDISMPVQLRKGGEACVPSASGGCGE